jgi:hypothetical protein
MQELSITVKTAHQRFTEKELVYDPIHFCRDNPFLIERVQAAVARIGLLPEEEAPKITVKSVIHWQR